ncbi:hypothetical protein ANN_21628 [Periplaneta americana]|uniref:Uncharacterized protein n=1 Tax=Periplaneta americana TaxID=6978 RepID=A0ABQ8S5Z1_PERAM|nr:hypothetical protein ANN_21628 [Periplaneta americana]
MYAMEGQKNWPPYHIISWLSCLMSDALLVSLLRFKRVFGQLTKQQNNDINVVLTTCLLPTSLGAPQIFPFSNLRSYFDHQVRNGPGIELKTLTDTTSFGRTSLGESKIPSKQQFPTNHRPDIAAADPSLHYYPVVEVPAGAAATAPGVKYHPLVVEAPSGVAATAPLLKGAAAVPLRPPVPEQVLTAPVPGTPDLYGAIAAPTQFPLGVVGEKTQTKAPAQKVETPAPVTQATPTPVAKVAKAPNHQYPKKWKPEKEKSKPSNFEPKKSVKEFVAPKRVVPLLPAINEQVEICLAARTILQVASETGFSGITAGAGGYDISGGGGAGGGGGGDRVEFQMHGQHGPHSYKFGYDTGKG